MKFLLVFLTLFLLAACEADNGNGNGEDPMEGKFENPVFEPVIADPSIIRTEDGTFYAYGTEDAWEHSTDFRYAPIIKSDNLVDWEYVGDAFEQKPDWKGFAYIWAPDIQYFNDQYYLYYSLSVWDDPNPAIGVATADNPEGPFEDHGKLFDSDSIGVQNSIDPYVHIDDDGTKYMFWGSFHGIYAIELSEDGLSTVGEKVHIAGNAFEAPYIIERDGYYYFFGSTGSCCAGANSTYQVRVGRSENLLGPYVDRQGRDIRGTNGSLVVGDGEQFVGNGHNAAIQDDAGEWWMVYHGIDKDEPYLPGGATRRPMMIDRIIWDSQGWPQLENFSPSEGPTEAPYIESEEEQE